MEFPSDFVREWKGAATVDLHEGEVEVDDATMATGKHLAAGTIRVCGPTGRVFDVGGTGGARFLAAAAKCGYYGQIKVPVEEEASTAVQKFVRYREGRRRQFRPMAAQRTRDKRRQRAIVEALLRRCGGDCWRPARSCAHLSRNPHVIPKPQDCQTNSAIPPRRVRLRA